jgi:hypothetical protein
VTPESRPTECEVVNHLGKLRHFMLSHDYRSLYSAGCLNIPEQSVKTCNIKVSHTCYPGVKHKNYKQNNLTDHNYSVVFAQYRITPII